MKNKALGLLLAGIMAFSMVGCAGKATTNKNEGSVAAKENSASTSLVELEIKDNSTYEFRKNKDDTVEPDLRFNKVLSDRTHATQAVDANAVPKDATGIVIEFEMKDCTVEFDKVSWYAEFKTSAKNCSILETKGMPQYEGNGKYKAVLAFGDYSEGAAFEKLNFLRIEWYEGNNKLSGKEVAGEFVLTKAYYCTDDSIKDVEAKKL